MYAIYLGIHSITRYLVVFFLFGAILMSIHGYTQKKSFSNRHNAIRHWTATIAHIQLIIGILLYAQSPIALYFIKNIGTAIKSTEMSFFGLYHSVAMLTAVVLITIGSALAKRREKDEEKFKTIAIWFGIALLIIFIVIPWPFSPFVNRPYIRPF